MAKRKGQRSYRDGPDDLWCDMLVGWEGFSGAYRRLKHDATDSHGCEMEHIVKAMEGAMDELNYLIELAYETTPEKILAKVRARLDR
ncbi:MAG TPA: hypothetical protein VH682_22705 [Gemmataceae bacterium]|jgi:hypothetical protein